MAMRKTNLSTCARQLVCTCLHTCLHANLSEHVYRRTPQTQQAPCGALHSGARALRISSSSCAAALSDASSSSLSSSSFAALAFLAACTRPRNVHCEFRLYTRPHTLVARKQAEVRPIQLVGTQAD